MYDPNNLVGKTIDLEYKLYKSQSSTDFKNTNYQSIKKKAYYDSSSSDNKVKRYYLSTDGFDKSLYLYRRYELNKIDKYDVTCLFDFTNNEIKNEEIDNILLVTHGGVAKVIHSYFYDMTNEEFSSFFLENCEIREYNF